MIVAIHQPHYLPWLRYVDKIARSDVFVLLDDAAYTKNGWQNRNKIKGAHGWMYLTVPVLRAYGKPIREVHINNQERWRTKHWTALCTNYARAPFFDLYRAHFERIYAREWETLHELSVHMLQTILSLLGVRTRLLRSSALGVPGTATPRLVEICAQLGATTYLTGDYAAGNHLEMDLFRERGIDVRLQGWQCQEYRQQHIAVGFLPDLSIVDLLFNQGEGSLALLERCHRPETACAIAPGA
jgi:WbqC-like protein family